jgi:hypothetical protein
MCFGQDGMSFQNLPHEKKFTCGIFSSMNFKPLLSYCFQFHSRMYSGCETIKQQNISSILWTYCIYAVFWNGNEFKDFLGYANKPEIYATPTAIPVGKGYVQQKWFIIVLLKDLHVIKLKGLITVILCNIQDIYTVWLSMKLPKL